MWEKIIRAVLSGKSVTDEQLKLVGQVMVLEPELASQMYAAIDKTGRFFASSSEHWVRVLPYHKGDLASENAHVIKTTRERVEVLVELPPPKN